MGVREIGENERKSYRDIYDYGKITMRQNEKEKR